MSLLIDLSFPQVQVSYGLPNHPSSWVRPCRMGWKTPVLLQLNLRRTLGVRL
jgi:hypothetical protein